MTITEVLQAIHVKYDFNVEYVEPGSDDYEVRLALVNEKVNLWENEDGILWRELFVKINDSLTDDATFAVPDLLTPESKVLINSCYYDYISPEMLQEQEKESPGQKVYTVTGSDVEKVLNLPLLEANEPFTFSYYKKANKYATGLETEPIEMSDPYFLVTAVAGELFLDDGDTEKGGVATQIALAKLNAMATRNAIVPVFTELKQPDYDFKGYGN